MDTLASIHVQPADELGRIPLRISRADTEHVTTAWLSPDEARRIGQDLLDAAE